MWISCRGFSLVEVCIAIGIVAFMVLPLVSLAIHANDAIKDSTAETHASSIAHRIFAGLSLSTRRSGILIETGGDETTQKPRFESVNLKQLVSGGEHIFLLVDKTGRVIERADAEAYEKGYRTKNTTTIGGTFARIRILGRRESVHQSDTIIGGPDLFLVEVAVETPAAAPKLARRTHAFHAYLKLSDAVANF